jgi:hypothetical protein
MSNTRFVLAMLLILSIVITGFYLSFRGVNIAPDNGSVPSLSVIEYDGCEYLYSRIYGVNGESSLLAHKGNCKYCAARAAGLGEEP